MRYTPIAGLLLSLVVGLPALAEDKASPNDNKAPAGFTALFNGKDLTGWQAAIPINKRNSLSTEERAKLQKEYNDETLPNWKVVDGMIFHTGKGGKFRANLATVEDYENFELLIDWKINKKGDSGLYLKGIPQVQIWDSDNLGANLKADIGTGSGGLWNNPAGSKGKQPLKKADKPVGEWNTFRILMYGDEVTVYLNNQLVVDKARLNNYWAKSNPPLKEFPKAGPIELQHHGDELWFKNIYIKKLDARK